MKKIDLKRIIGGIVVVLSFMCFPISAMAGDGRTVCVNGKPVAVQSFGTGEGPSFYKLRGLAAALNGTEKQFDVGWDGTKHALTITTGKAYQEQPGDLIAEEVESNKIKHFNSKIYVNGVAKNLIGFSANGNTFISVEHVTELLDTAVFLHYGTENFDTKINHVKNATKTSNGLPIYYYEDVKAGKVKLGDYVMTVKGYIVPYDIYGAYSAIPDKVLPDNGGTVVGYSHEYAPIKAKAPGTLYQSDKNRRTAQEGDTFIDANGKKWTLHKDPVTGTFNPADPIGIDLGRITIGSGIVGYGTLSDGKDGGVIGDSYTKAPNGRMDWYKNFLDIKNSGYDKPSKPGTKNWEMSPNKYYTWSAKLETWSWTVGK